MSSEIIFSCWTYFLSPGASREIIFGCWTYFLSARASRETIFGCWTYFLSAGASRETICGCWTYFLINAGTSCEELFSHKRSAKIISGWNVFFVETFRGNHLMVEDWVLKGSPRIRENKNGKIQIFSLKAWNLITKQSKS